MFRSNVGLSPVNLVISLTSFIAEIPADNASVFSSVCLHT